MVTPTDTLRRSYEALDQGAHAIVAAMVGSVFRSRIVTSPKLRLLLERNRDFILEP
jgi:hypothetical protein